MTSASKFPLGAMMPNGASIKDWLGTAELAASHAAEKITTVREQSLTVGVERDVVDLTNAISLLEQATEELTAILSVVEIVRGTAR